MKPAFAEDTCTYTFKPNPAKRKGLDIRILTETPDVTGLSVYLNAEPLDYLNIFKDSQPEKVAYEFCLKNKLNFEHLQPITEQIKSLINKKESTAGKKKKQDRDRDRDSLDDLPESPLGSNKERKNNSKAHMKYNMPVSSNERKVIKQSAQSELNDSRKTPVLFPSEPYQKHKTQIQASKSSNNYHGPSLTTALMNRSSKPTGKTVQDTQENDQEDNIHITNQIELKKLIESMADYIQIKAKTPKSTKANCLPLNFGERLFHKGVKMQKRTKDKLLSNEKEAGKESQLTFQPTTNPISYNSLSKRYINHKSYNDNRTITNYKDVVNKRLNDLREKHNYHEQYSFAPSLDKKSLRIENSKEVNKDKRRYECLYENFKNQQVNKDKLSHKIYNKDILFKPTINDYSCAYTSMSFTDRQGYFLSKSVEKKKQTKESIESNISKETGRPYFHPQINDYYKPTDSNRITFNNLYLDSCQNRNKLKENEEQRNNLFLTLQNSSHINKESHDMFEGMKEKTFKQIFKCLDKNQEGIITHIYMDIKALPKNTAAILLPIFSQLQEENVTLNEGEFTTACFHLFELLSYVERKELLSFNKKPKTINQTNQFTFKPSINPDRVDRLNKSSQSVISSNKNSLNSIRQNILQQLYPTQPQGQSISHIYGQAQSLSLIEAQATGDFTAQNETLEETRRF